MTRPILSLAVVLAVTAAPLLVACGGGTSGSGPADSGATEGGGGPDGGKHDGSPGSDGGGGEGGVGGLPEGGVYPQGTQLVTSGSVVIQGVTSDGYAIYIDSSGSSPTLNAVSLTGGAPKSIDAYDGSGGVAVSGAVTVYFNGVSQTTGAATVGVWTSAHSKQTLSTAGLAAIPGGGSLDVSKDGLHVILLDNATATTADVTVIDTDGTNKKVLVPGVHLDYTTCPTNIGFSGAYAIVAYCAANPADAGASDGGASPTATIATFTGTGWATTGSLSTAAFTGFAHDSAGAHVLYGTAGGMQVGTLSSGASTLIDAAGLGGVFTSDGTSVVYVTSAGAINLAPAAGGGTPTTLQASGFKGLYGLSPDNKWLLAYKQVVVDQQTGAQTSDVYLASATASGTATALSSATSAAIYGDFFTPDSSHALWTANVSGAVGDFMSAAVTGGTPTKLGTNEWINITSTGAKTTFNVNWVSGGTSGQGTADIQSVDTSATAAPKLLVSQADAFYFMSAARDKVVYSWSYVSGDSHGGIWVVPAP
jgi:hypothetical protein